MWFRFAFVFITVLLMGCIAHSSALPHNSTQLGTAQFDDVAWGERVSLASPVTRFRVLVGNKEVNRRTFDSARSVVDLPFSPTLPTLESASDPVTEEVFAVPPTAEEQESYVNRGRIELISDGETLTLEPYGAVLSGQVHALAGVRGECIRFFRLLDTDVPDAFDILAELAVPISDNESLCHAVFKIGNQDTGAALESLEAALRRFSTRTPPVYTDVLGDAGFVVDKNSLSSLDPPGSGTKSIDPTCDQIVKWLDPISANDYDLIFRDQLRTDLGVPASGATGAGVNVAIIGGGVGPNDNVRCEDAFGTVFFRGHDTHIRNIIRAVAPDVNIQAFKVCNAEGTCSSAEIVRALLQTLTLAGARQDPHTLVNLSLGGPLPDRPTFEVLRLLGEPPFVVAVIASGGNGPFAPAHYPASYSSGVADPAEPSLTNVISFAATGLRLTAAGTEKPGYVIAGFNTRANADFFAPGVNVCLDAAQTFRCDTSITSAFPDTLGATGSSFAAPVGTGIAALFLEAADLSPADLRGCLTNNLKPDPVTNLAYAAYGSDLCR